ncbi:MAG: succinate dehydrogenase, hydrophobic membrane anchor protein [Burkholderiaceae bacterium]|jgi:succinate dehydrogenase / fumarate reductase membrane anchor subunit|nr:succinate dehydrogenase, hydrophobic membrane anchor protein [Burkholderiaceae bacterium]
MNNVNYGTKRTVVGAHYGLRDWLTQRISGAAMAVFTVVLLVQVIFAPGPLSYDTWAAIFSAQWMKFLTYVAILALAWHAWVGMRDIWMDYAKPASLRLLLEALTIVWLVGCAGWALQVLWHL